MTINYLGHLAIGIKTNDASLIINPFEKSSVGFSMKKTVADIVVISKDIPECNNVQGTSESAYVIKGPGEYEIKGVMILGFPMFEDKNDDGVKINQNTIYRIECEGLNICHLGSICRKLTDEEYDQLGSVDVLILPVGDDGFIDNKVATEIVNKLEPSTVIPVAYFDNDYSEKYKGLMPIEKFLEAMGASKPELEKSVKIKSTDLDEEGEGTRVVLLDRK